MLVEKVRIDKWLWAVRVFKTRSLASDACNAGRVKINGTAVKPAHHVKIGETIHIQKGQEKKILVVSQLTQQRVGAPIAQTCYIDQSPPPLVVPKADSAFHLLPTAYRDKGTGRPTKRQRREIDGLHQKSLDETELGWYDDEEESEDKQNESNNIATRDSKSHFSLFFDDGDDDE